MAQRIPVGGTTLDLFGSDGCIQEGNFTLKVWEGQEGDGVGMATLGLQATETTRLEHLSRQQAAGCMPKIGWLDDLTARKVEAAKQEDKKSAGWLYMKITLPSFNPPVVYCEVGGNAPLHASTAVRDIDPEIHYSDNLIESKHLRMTRNRRRGPTDRDLKPNPAIRDQLTLLTQRPPTEALTPDEKDMIWRFRYYLSKNQRALTKFLRSVDWRPDNDVEVKQAIELMGQWEPIGVDDALEILSASFTNPSVRAYAVSRLETADDEDLILYLLQLVQSLRYEADIGSTGASAANDGADDNISSPIQQSFSPTSVAGFLIRRALLDVKLGNYFFWYLHVECGFKENAAYRTYTQVKKAFTDALARGTPDQVELGVQLKRQRDFLTGLRNLARDVKSASGNRPKKIEKLKSILQTTEGFQAFQPMLLPLNPDVKICGVVAEKATIFKSALMPLKLTFLTTQQTHYSIIYKVGDDLRQDQLVLQIIVLMDKLMKKENLDLKLTPYQALATSSEIGMIEFIPKSMPLAAVFKEQGSIRGYLRKHFPDENGTQGISTDVMDTYVKSCAGYCVITYLLGIGDRHFDNLMLCEDGHLFHIDFGFILGRDPKPYPPPMKLTKEMLEAMGGANGEEIIKFRSHCYNAFLILRKHANLIINLFTLMLDSGVQDIALDPDKTVMKVQEKFMLDLVEEEAVKRFQELLDESVNAMFAVFVERIHSWAQYWRK